MASGKAGRTGLFSGFLTGTALCATAGVVFTLTNPIEDVAAPLVAKPEPSQTAQDLPQPPTDPAEDTNLVEDTGRTEDTDQAEDTDTVETTDQADDTDVAAVDPVEEPDTGATDTDSSASDTDTTPDPETDPTPDPASDPAPDSSDEIETETGTATETAAASDSEPETATATDLVTETSTSTETATEDTGDGDTVDGTEIATADPISTPDASPEEATDPDTSSAPGVEFVEIAPSPRYLPNPDDEAGTPTSPFAVDTENPERVAVPSDPPPGSETAAPDPNLFDQDEAPVIRPLDPNVAVLKPPAGEIPTPEDSPVELGLNVEPDVSAPVPDIPAWQAYAAEFEVGTTGMPLLAIVLEVVPDDGVPLESVAGLKLPISFVVPSDLPEAGKIAQSLRQSGHEVLVRPSGPQSLDASLDTETTRKRLEAAFSRVPEVIGIIDQNSQAAREPDLAETVLRGLAIRGHAAVVGGGRVRNVLSELAEQNGIRFLDIARVLDETRDAARIANGLDRAAFTARNKGNTLVLGHTYPETMQAVISWALSKNNKQVTLAPASALMKN